MTRIVFYEKPGCTGNRRQQAKLRSERHQVVVRDLLSTPWSRQELRSFFASKPVEQWFNLSAPKIKSGEIDITQLNEEQALDMMLAEPLLICRPLLEFGAIRQSGFTSGPVLDAIGMSLSPAADLNSCPMGDNSPVCEVG